MKNSIRRKARNGGQVFALPKEYGFLARFGMEEVAHKKYLNDYLTGRWPGSPARGELYNDDPRLGDARLCGTTASLCGVESARRQRGSGRRDAGARRLCLAAVRV